jgi:hypothetical protein
MGEASYHRTSVERRMLHVGRTEPERRCPPCSLPREARTQTPPSHAPSRSRPIPELSGGFAMKSPICLVNRKQCASFRIACRMLAIAPLMLAATNLSAHAQTSDDVSSSSAASASSPADWTQFHRDNMQRWNPYETIIGVNNVGSLQVKWKTPIGIASRTF